VLKQYSLEENLHYVTYRVIVQQSKQLGKATNSYDSKEDGKQQEAEVLDPAVLNRNNVQSELPKPTLGFRGSLSHVRGVSIFRSRESAWTREEIVDVSVAIVRKYQQ
jgi:hypothetical protein